MTENTYTDCRTEEGITVGLIDSIITICRILKNRDLDSKPIQAALVDLATDDDFENIVSKCLKHGLLNEIF